MARGQVARGALLLAAAFGATPASAQRIDELKAPAGFKVEYFAKDVAGARMMAIAPDGAVYVSQPSQGRVLRLVDANHDGVAESRSVVVSGLTLPHGLAFHAGYLYIAATGAVMRVSLDANGVAKGAPDTLARYSGGGGHFSRTVIFGADGAMYVSIGSTCNICVETSDDRAAVLRFDDQGRNRMVFSRGLRNAVGLALHPVTHQVWVTQNERDMLAPDYQDLPPEEINILQEGADYGWPYCYGNRIPNPEFKDAARCRNTVPPALELQAHSAPLGITFLANATNFPREWRGDAIVAYHGSWNRSVPTGAKLVRIRVANGKPVGVEDFVTGWQRADNTRWGRPVDVVVAADGSLLVSDDRAGVIYRVSH